MAYQQTAGAIAGLYEFAPQEEESEVAESAESDQAGEASPERDPTIGPIIV